MMQNGAHLPSRPRFSWGRCRSREDLVTAARTAGPGGRPLRVLLTTDWWEPVVNGVVASVLTLRRELELLGCDVRVLTLSPGLRTSREPGIYRIGSVSAGVVYDSARIGMPTNRAVLQEILRWHPDVVHSQCEFSTYVWARRIARTLGIPLVHTYHTIYEDYTHYYSPSRTVGRKVIASLSRHVLDRTDAVIVPTAKVRTLLTRYRVRRPIHVVPTGLDLSRFRPAMTEQETADAAALRASINVRPEQKVLLSVCRLAKEKNLEEVIEHVARSGRTDCVLVIVGDGPYRAELEAAVDRHGIREQVRFTGCVAPQDVNRWYRIGDVFVSASRSETQGLTFIEALASGLPLLCHRDPSIAQVVIDGRTGYQIETSEEFSARLAELLDNDQERDAFRMRAVEHAEATCGSRAFGEGVLGVYLSTRPRRGQLLSPRREQVAA